MSYVFVYTHMSRGVCVRLINGYFNVLKVLGITLH